LLELVLQPYHMHVAGFSASESPQCWKYKWEGVPARKIVIVHILPSRKTRSPGRLSLIYGWRFS